jgi:hypothetical protein
LEVLEQIIFKTDGVPLFVEELTKNVLEGDHPLRRLRESGLVHGSRPGIAREPGVEF